MLCQIENIPLTYRVTLVIKLIKESQRNIIMQLKECINFHYCLDLFKFLRVWVFCLNVCLCTTWVPGCCRGQKRVLDLLELDSDGCDTTCGCWKPIPSPL